MVRGHANIRGIAAAAGVSTATVSRALQDPPAQNVSPELRSRILAICAEMHYVPNAHTRRMFSHRSDTVALLFPPRRAISSDFHGHMVDSNFTNCVMGAQEFLAGKGIGLLLNELSDEYLSSRKYLRMVRSKEVDGILVWGIRSTQSWFSELEQESVPVVMLQTYLEDYVCPHVIADDQAGMAELVELVLASGHERIGFLPAPETATTGRFRNEAVRETLRRGHVEPAVESSSRGYGFEYGYEAGRALLSGNPDITCVIASNDMAAWGCIRAARELGRRIPEDLSVVGCDGLAFPFDTRVNSYFLPSVDIGCRGAELLLEMINGHEVPEETVLPVQIIRGNTLGKVPRR